ncbi:hypothetical protein O3M35_008154 [Rhynocoris fuscipes]|uniref:Uncharacterized protein n=1 Tax=Rhynocoris fuscipes TaxID=488301 RepID=A0AAW1D5C9_9HEMI
MLPKIVKMGSWRLKTDISVEIWKSNFFMITILPLYKEGTTGERFKKRTFRLLVN